jgi:hypothetical protein
MMLLLRNMSDFHVIMCFWLWDDDIIDPVDTSNLLSCSLNVGIHSIWL